MTVLVGYHHDYVEHDAGRSHPEAPSRVEAALEGVEDVRDLVEVVDFSPRLARDEEILRVHSAEHLTLLSSMAAEGGGDLDPDTHLGPRSLDAARRAAGAGPEAVERLEAGEATAAFLIVRPPGHHASRNAARGFCLLNNVAITAALLAERGERVVIIDYDAHHGNGTQELFYRSADVLYVSLHQYPAYPGTGWIDEIGEGEGFGTTLNVPFPSGAAGDDYRQAVEELVIPAVEVFSPTWLLLSAGFDAHRDDPLTNLALSAGDYADLTSSVMRLGAPGRRIAFLEGGYDLAALRRSVASCVAALGGEVHRPEGATTRADHVIAMGPTPREMIAAVGEFRERHAGQPYNERWL